LRTDTYTEKHGMKLILSEVERVAEFCKLSSSSASKLRLLTEEMLELTVRLFDDLKYSFYIENEKKHFTLNLIADTYVSLSQREKMLSLSSDGKNRATKGLLGKISTVFEGLLSGDSGYDLISMPFCDNLGIHTYFTLSNYQDEIQKMFQEESQKKSQSEEWDELGKSIIANLAKEVVIGVRNKKVEMIVTVDFN